MESDGTTASTHTITGHSPSITSSSRSEDETNSGSDGGRGVENRTGDGDDRSGTIHKAEDGTTTTGQADDVRTCSVEVDSRRKRPRSRHGSETQESDMREAFKRACVELDEEDGFDSHVRHQQRAFMQAFVADIKQTLAVIDEVYAQTTVSYENRARRRT